MTNQSRSNICATSMPCAAGRLSAPRGGTAPRSTEYGPKFAHLLLRSRSVCRQTRFGRTFHAVHERLSSSGSRARFSLSGAAGAASARFMAHLVGAGVRVRVAGLGLRLGLGLGLGCEG